RRSGSYSCRRLSWNASFGPLSLWRTSIHGRQGNIGATLIKKHHCFRRQLARVLAACRPVLPHCAPSPPTTFFSRPAQPLDRSTHGPPAHTFTMSLLPEVIVVHKSGIVMRMSMGHHASLHLSPFFRGPTRNRFGPYMPFLSSLFQVSLDGRKRHAKELHNL